MMRRLLGLGVLALVLALGGEASAQGLLAPYARLQFFDNNGNPCAGCKLATFAAGTTTPAAVHTDSALSVAHANPVVLDGSGRATIYLSQTSSFKFTLRTALDVDIWTVDNIVGAQSGILTVSASDTRGLRVTRASADAGLSVASTGGSGKTYGLVSDTTGAFTIRDDSDGTPSLQWTGDNITAALTGTFTVSGGILSVTGAGNHTFNASSASINRLAVRNSNAGAAAQAAFMVGNNSADNAGFLYAFSSGFTPSGPYLADSVVLESTRPGGLGISATNATGDVRIYAGVSGVPAITVADTSVTTITSLTPTLLNSGTAQPAFQAWNTVDDALGTTATLDFDTEIYDIANNFAADIFTAPVAGRYHFCVVVSYVDNGAGTYELRLNTTTALYMLDILGATTAGTTSTCLDAQMSAGNTAFVQVFTSDASITIDGNAGYITTYFSGRLVP